MIAIIGAMQEEVNEITALMENKETKTFHSVVFVTRYAQSSSGRRFTQRHRKSCSSDDNGDVFGKFQRRRDC